MSDTKKTYTDIELLRQMREGNQAALAILYERYRSWLIREAYCLIKDAPAAEDLIQDVFTSVWNLRAKLEIKNSFQPYLLTAVTNRCLNFLRSKQQQQNHDAEYQYIKDWSTSPEPFEREELGRLLEQALQRVPPAARKTFILQYQEGYSQKDIAEEQNISKQVVRNNTSLALKILREILGFKKK
ncbi:RNA polymerase sigma-70 factor, ECF subfamily [Chitinophaga sp. YR627]|uniref:RNA polymerase sigma factor n=1 Tax=Chitinophaga sp. YR627 TaxID=1881041 RepID=UPI0008F36275|nr:RNA polymerase sigma-70 factor [Chitinophaga sp. YR627]SFO29688.1 RNA polymerase sigma-70 factor, ECF subfamily [Chitinophaga sp. YR627]